MQPGCEVVLHHCRENCHGTGLDGLFRLGWEDSLLAQKLPYWDWLEVQRAVLKDAHWKVLVMADAPTGAVGVTRREVVGGAVLVESTDAQVGPSLVLWHQFLRPEFRGSHGLWRKVLRKAEEAARIGGYKFLIWTHRDEKSGRVYLTHKEV